MAKRQATKKRKPSRVSSRLTPAKKVSSAKAKTTTAAKAAVVPERTGPRQLKKGRYQEFLERRQVAHKGKVAGAPTIFWRSLMIMKKNGKLFFGIWVLYVIFDIVLVRGLSSSSTLVTAKAAADLKSHGFIGGISTAVSLFNTLASNSAAATSDLGQIYQAIVIIIVSLALVWCLRKVYANVAVRIRDGFYQGMYPLVVVMLVMVVIGVELIPFVLGATLFANLFGGEIVTSGLEKIVAIALCAVLAFPTFYMLSSSIFGLYIATLPDMTPIKALRSARELVHHRRLLVARKLLFIPVAIFLLGIAIMLPILILLTPVAPWLFLALTLSALFVFHSYMYGLYRELL